MAIKTQGTEFWAMVPATGELLDLGCVTSIDGIDTTVEQIETTCLKSLARTYVAGLATPGSASFSINTDPRNSNHIRLHQLKVAGVALRWVVGWLYQDAAGNPVVPGPAPVSAADDGEFVLELPATRAWVLFDGFVTAFPFAFSQNSVVQSSISVQITGEPELVPATA